MLTRHYLLAKSLGTIFTFPTVEMVAERNKNMLRVCSYDHPVIEENIRRSQNILEGNTVTL